MEQKINIAELLKDCPQGMELDCTLFDDVHFDSVDEVCDIIKCYIKDSHHKIGISFNKYGHYSNIRKAKCVIFPKGKTTWEGFQRPFKVGDVVHAIDEGNEYIFIFKEIYENERVYCYLNLKGGDLRIQEVWLTDYNPTHRLATEEEKQRLFRAIKDNGYKWNEKTKTLDKLINPKFKVGNKIKYKNGKNINGVEQGVILSITDNAYDVAVINNMGIIVPIANQDNWELVLNKFDIDTLKPFDKVLVRDNDTQEWSISLFSHYNGLKNYKYSCINGNGYAQCIPYEGNEHLLGTTVDCDEFYKTWE